MLIIVYGGFINKNKDNRYIINHNGKYLPIVPVLNFENYKFRIKLIRPRCNHRNNECLLNSCIIHYYIHE